LEVSPNTIGHKIARYSKWSQLYHSQQMQGHKLQENVCADGFETFVTSQYFPGHVNLLMGDDSQFAYGWDYCFLRRKGRMTPAQKAKRAEIEKTWKIPRGALKKSFQRGVTTPLAKLIENKTLPEILLTTDEHPVYPGAIKTDKNLASLYDENICKHRTISSKKNRDHKNELFSVNYMDREIRKDLANHVRETTRFAHEPNMMMDRMTVYLVEHNPQKRFRIKAPKIFNDRHCTIAGVDPAKVIVPRLVRFLRRPWYSDTMAECYQILWKRQIPRPLGMPKRIQAKFWLE